MTKILALIAVIFLFCAGASAQNVPPSEAGANVMFLQSAAAGPAGPVISDGMFFSAELPGNGKVVTGAPFTATVSTEMTQILADGNRINNKTTASSARDSQGRTRREETMGMVGPWHGNGPKLVFIHDPTSQTNYVLDANKQTVTVMKHMGSHAAGGESGFRVEHMGKRFGGDLPEETKTQPLGTATMEGVTVEGKRVTRTIPAGQIGNAQPIEITSEVWTSPELQVIVMSKHSDPRFGETIYQLTGIQRVEPDHTLFEIPPGFTVRNVPMPMGPHLSHVEGEPGPFGVVGGMESIGK